MTKFNLQKADAHMGAAICLGFATLFLLFTCISSPVVESMHIYRLRYRFDNAVRWVDVGLWGYCIEDLQRTTALGTLPLDPGVVAGCPSPRVGWTLDKAVADALHIQSLDGLYSKVHTGFLTLYPIVTLMSFLSCVFQTGIHLSRRTRSMVINLTPGNVKAVFIYNSIATLFVFLAFFIQLSVGVKAKVELKKSNFQDWDTRHSFVWGNTLWLSVIAVILHIIDLVILHQMKHEAIDREAEQEARRAAIRAKNKKPKKQQRRRQEATPTPPESTMAPITRRSSPDDEEKASVPIPLDTPPAYDLDGYRGAT